MHQSSKETVIQENFSYFKEKHPQIEAAYEEYGRLVHEIGGPLDEKTRWLIKVAVTTAGQNRFAQVTHIKKALKAGCTPEEIEHAILLTGPSSGFPVMMEGILALRSVLGDKDK